jgi:hypothetical protein
MLQTFDFAKNLSALTFGQTVKVIQSRSPVFNFVTIVHSPVYNGIAGKQSSKTLSFWTWRARSCAFA